MQESPPVARLGGRPHLDGGAPVLAEARPGAGWCVPLPDLDAAPIRDLDPAVRASLADAWLADGLGFHAAVGAWSRGVIELMAVGGPGDLVAATETTALDAMRCAEIAFSLHAAYAHGAPMEPGPLPALAARSPRPAAGPDGAADPRLLRFAADTFHECCVAAAITAAVAGHGAERTPHAPLAALLRDLAVTHDQHAALGWSTLAWAVAAGGPAVLAAVQAAAAESFADSRGPATDTPALAYTAALNAHGRLSPTQARRLRAETWSRSVAPGLRWLAAVPEDGRPDPTR